MSDLEGLSVEQLQEVIESAESALKAKQISERKEVYAQIKELAASVGATVEIYNSSDKKRVTKAKVPPKYRHPENTELTWTGRGMKPIWLRDLLDLGRDQTEFLI